MSRGGDAAFKEATLPAIEAAPATWILDSRGGSLDDIVPQMFIRSMGLRQPLHAKTVSVGAGGLLPQSSQQMMDEYRQTLHHAP